MSAYGIGLPCDVAPEAQWWHVEVSPSEVLAERVLRATLGDGAFWSRNGGGMS
jgi:hypothetical protein